MKFACSRGDRFSNVVSYWKYRIVVLRTEKFEVILTQIIFISLVLIFCFSGHDNQVVLYENHFKSLLLHIYTFAEFLLDLNQPFIDIVVVIFLKNHNCLLKVIIGKSAENILSRSHFSGPHFPPVEFVFCLDQNHL